MPSQRRQGLYPLPQVKDWNASNISSISNISYVSLCCMIYIHFSYLSKFGWCKCLKGMWADSFKRTAWAQLLFLRNIFSSDTRQGHSFSIKLLIADRAESKSSLSLLSLSPGVFYIQIPVPCRNKEVRRFRKFFFFLLRPCNPVSTAGSSAASHIFTKECGKRCG